ncbi:hypothetical protein A2U01_0087461 [Trifolium medium]|uniref:Uncharacterized protein n=1 Tax=Trifolium medium TaxID=97028 RepID=A0A392TYF0_9FABA|nr:hypothetical protein [Trifolium medium]
MDRGKSYEYKGNGNGKKKQGNGSATSVVDGAIFLMTVRSRMTSALTVES